MGEKTAKAALKVAVWNVNGIRSCRTKGFDEWLARTGPDVVGLQEVRAFEAQIEDAVAHWKSLGYAAHFFAAERPGYSGTAVLSRLLPARVIRGTGHDAFDAEGRFIAAEFADWTFASVYFPKGSGPDRSNSRVPFKLEFYRAVLDQLARTAKKRPVVVGGDFNTAHEEIDLRNWKTNTKTSGFLPEERVAFGEYLERGFRDVFRERHPGADGHYTWWSQRQGARARNVGWRIDYLLASEAAAARVRRAWIEPGQMGSDHCPLGIEIEI